MEATFWWAAGVGFVAQAIDGALGMAYGVSSNAMLLSAGVPPAAASAAVHLAEVATTGASGLSHLAFRNVDRELFDRLVWPGVLGAVLGAVVLATVPVAWVKVPVALYLLAMGLRLVSRALWPTGARRPLLRGVRRLGFAGGFCDSIGGGGWGPIVTTTLVARAVEPRYAIGSVNLAEFFVALASSAAFAVTIGLGHGPLVAGLVLGGVLAAPLAAWSAKVVPQRWLMAAVGLLIAGLSVRSLLAALG